MSFTDFLRARLMPGPNAAMINESLIELNGDSIMEGGIGDALKRDGFTIADRSVSGDTAANAWRRFGYTIRSAAVVVIEQGTNDLSLGDDPVPYIRRMAKLAQDEGRTVVLTGIPYRQQPAAGNWLAANFAIRVLARELGCVHAQWDTVPGSFGPDDKLHPDEGMKARLIGALAGALIGCRAQAVPA